MSNLRRVGLPEAMRMRHDTHFVDQLGRPGGVPVGRLIPIEDIDPNPNQPRHTMGVAEANVLSAGPRRSTIEFVTPNRVTYRPELGVLYPSELDTGMRIYVEYDRNNPDLVRVQDRNASLAIIPAGSIAVVGWLIAMGALAGVALVERRVR